MLSSPVVFTGSRFVSFRMERHNNSETYSLLQAGRSLTIRKGTMEEKKPDPEVHRFPR